jgi:hypothetical protein
LWGLGGYVTLNGQASDEDAYFELSFSPNVQFVSTVRRFVAEFYSESLGSDEITSRLEVATHELLENAVRYSADGNTTIRVGIKRSPELRVQIDTSNRAELAYIVTMRHTLDELIAAGDPAAHYQVLMQRSLKRAKGSGLGLGRVRAESGMTISYEVKGDVVRIRAEARFPVAGASPGTGG